MSHLKDKNLLVFGDSIMYGSGNGGFGVGEYLARDYGMRLKKYAVGGARVGYDKGKSWLPEQIIKALEEEAAADYIVFDGFTNDCNISDGKSVPDVALGEIPAGYPPNDVFSLVREGAEFSPCFQAVIYTLLSRYPCAKLLFVRPHNMGRRDDSLQKLYGGRAIEICKKWGVPFVDLYEESGMNTFIPLHRDAFTADSYGWGRGDCTHPNAKGYELKYMPLIAAKLLSL